MTAHLILPGSYRLPFDLGVRPYDDILQAVRAAEDDGYRPLRLDAGDWLTLQEIAWRAGVSRELVRLWSIGARKEIGYAVAH